MIIVYQESNGEEKMMNYPTNDLNKAVEKARPLNGMVFVSEYFYRYLQEENRMLKRKLSDIVDLINE